MREDEQGNDNADEDATTKSNVWMPTEERGSAGTDGYTTERVYKLK